MVRFIFLLNLLFIVGCETVPIVPYVPFKTFYSQPPGDSRNWKQPIQLECIDDSNIYVYTNGDWWYSGPRNTSTKGWVPVGGGWYPWPYQVWPDKVTWLTPPWERQN